MKAKCPHCQDGCDRCEEGFMEVGFASGALYTSHCNACGEDNGGRIANSRFPREKWQPPGDCVWCKSLDVIWLEIGEISPSFAKVCSLCAQDGATRPLIHTICSGCGEHSCLSHARYHDDCPELGDQP